MSYYQQQQQASQRSSYGQQQQYYDQYESQRGSYYTDQQQQQLQQSSQYEPDYYGGAPPAAATVDDEEMPKQWLDDRIHGQSKYGDQERPPCPCCWVPPFVGWCPAVLETNFCCRWIGWVGCFPSELARCWCLNVTLILNLCGLILTAYACIAISDDYLLLTKSAFQELTLTDVNEPDAQPVEMFVGLKAAALNNQESGVGQIAIPFDQFCEFVNDGIERYMNPSDCNKCQEVSDSMVIALMISVATFIPTFFSEIARLYSGYDSNCVKGFVTTIGILTILLNLSVILGYTLGCGNFFYSGQVLFDSSGNVLPSDFPPESAAFDTRYDWKWGNGFITLLAGTGCKLLDVIINCSIPTPLVTRDLEEQKIYESIGGEELEEIKERAKPQGKQKVRPEEGPLPPGASA